MKIRWMGVVQMKRNIVNGIILNTWIFGIMVKPRGFGWRTTSCGLKCK
jgi:hypothetical protein